MDYFLKEAAFNAYARYESNYSTTCFVVPNNRAMIYFKKYFAEAAGKVIRSPKILPISKLVSRFSETNTADRLTLLFELYEIYIKELDVEMDFERFISVGEAMLNDFSETDNYLANPKELFAYIADLKEIELKFTLLSEEEKEILRKYWRSFIEEDNSREKEQFIKIWRTLPTVYERFTQKLRAKKIAYNGLQYRIIKEKIDAKTLDTSQFTTYIFIGFNALNAGEKNLFKHLMNEGKALFYWDADVFFVESELHEAGAFMRENLKLFGSATLNKLANSLNSTEKTITILGCTKEITQAKIIGQVLEKISPELAGFTDTAIVLTNENLVFPVLQSLPQSINPINVTMGFPFSATSLFGYLQLLLQFKIANLKGIDSAVSVDMAIRLLRALETGTSESLKHKIAELEASKQEYIKISKLKNLSEVVDLFVKPTETADTILQDILQLLFLLFVKDKAKTDALGLAENTAPEREYIFAVYKEIKRLRILLPNYGFGTEIGVNAMVRILREVLESIRISFSGETTEGLQIMGMLETRNIDFKNVIITGVNEGIFPATSTRTGFIPESVRFVFKLPQKHHKEAIQAYYFYRLLSRAENIFLLYDNVGGNRSGSELSRYVMQLQKESKINFIKHDLALEVKVPVRKDIRIKKNEAVFEVLNQYLVTENGHNKTFSASALSAYLSCKLKFYFRYIAKLRSDEVLRDDVNPIEFGIIVHSALEILYLQIMEEKNSKVIDKQDFERLKALIPEALETAYRKWFEMQASDEFAITKNRSVGYEVQKKLILAILNYDQKIAPFTILSLENTQDFRVNFDFELQGETKTVAFYGAIDRLDLNKGNLRIIDYKSGGVEKSINSVETLFAKSSYKNAGIFQLFFYAYIVKNKFPDYSRIEPGFYPLRGITADDFTHNITYGRDKRPILGELQDELLDQYITLMQQLMSEIFSPAFDFEQTEKPDQCTNCEYAGVCHRN